MAVSPHIDVSNVNIAVTINIISIVGFWHLDSRSNYFIIYHRIPQFDPQYIRCAHMTIPNRYHHLCRVQISNKDNAQVCFRICDNIFAWFMVPWINHSPHIYWANFGKSIPVGLYELLGRLYVARSIFYIIYITIVSIVTYLMYVLISSQECIEVASSSRLSYLIYNNTKTTNIVELDYIINRIHS